MPGPIPVVVNDMSANACSSYTWTANGTTYTQSGTYTYVSNCLAQVLNLSLFSTLIATVRNVSCNGGNDGAISTMVLGDTAGVSNPGLLISEIRTDPPLGDSNYEWVELVATDHIDFSTRPYTVIFSNNGMATSKGWVEGQVPSPPPRNSTYAFIISTGNVQPGDVVYVGGSLMEPTVRRLRVKSTSSEPGDGGIGSAFSGTAGVLGNGGIADGVAVFNRHVNQIDSNTVPVDAIFYGTGVGDAALSDTSKGFRLPLNDRYNGTRLSPSSYVAPEVLGSYSLQASGTYNRSTGVYTVPRTWTLNNSPWIGAVSNVSVISNSYSWSNGSTAKNISGLPSGIYSLTVTAPDGCTAIKSFTVSQPSAINIVLTTLPATCPGVTNGQISAVVSGGVAPYSYLWNTGDTTYSLSSLPAGTYQLTISDSNGCTATSQGIIGTGNNYPQILLSSLPVSCPAASNGSLNSTISSGTPPYSYLWSNGATTSAISDQPSGVYTLNVVDDRGCIATAQAVIDIGNDFPQITLSPQVVSCPAATNGSVSSSVSGGASPYTYSWSTGATTASVNLLQSGTYTLSLTDKNGCTGLSQTFIGVGSDYPQIQLTGLPVSCPAASNGIASAVVVAGVAPYTFFWSTGATTSTINQQPAGSYTLSVSDNVGCTASSQIMIGTDSIYPQVQLTAGVPICHGSSTGVMNSSVSGGNSPYEFLWSTGAVSSMISQQPAGSYTVTVTDAAGCSTMDSAVIGQTSPIIVSAIFPTLNSSGFPVHLSGSGFSNISEVRFGNVSASSFTVNGDTSISVNVPQGAQSGAVTVINNIGCTGRSTGVFTYLEGTPSLTIRMFIEGIYSINGYMDVPLVNSGLSLNAQHSDSVEIALANQDGLYDIVYAQKALLFSQGWATITLPGWVLGNSYYLVIRHRNTIPLWSKTPVNFNNESTYYNFSGNQAFSSIQTGSVNHINASSASCNATVISDGGSPVLSRGFCWSTSPNPTAFLPTKSVNGNGEGSYSGILTGLSFKTKYYVRAYAINGVGISYGNEVVFTTLDAGQFSDIDGNIYDTIAIGSQIWMKQNLKVSKYRNGDPLLTGLLNGDWQLSTSGAWCYYNNDPKLGKIYGKLYNWYAVADSRGLCPTGWHVPDDQEWYYLENVLGGKYAAGGPLKDTGVVSFGGLWNLPNTGATNISGFSGLPGGRREGNGNYSSIGNNGYWWTSSFTSTLSARVYILNFDNQYLNGLSTNNNIGYSVRCLKD